MSDRLRAFPDTTWENMALAEAEDRRREQVVLRSQATPDLAQQIADISFAYPELSGGVVTGMAVQGLNPLTPEADAIQQRNLELAEAGLNPPPQRVGFWDHGLGEGVKGFTRGATTFFQSLYDEVVKGGSAFLVGLGEGKDFGEAARSSFGYSPGALAVANWRQGRPVNLGSGFLPGGDLAPETEAALEQGQSLREAMANPAQVEMGLPLQQFSQQFQQESFQKIPGSEGVVDERTRIQGLTVTPGRFVASKVSEPGSTAFNHISGVSDLAANIFLDPANKFFKLAGSLKRANRALVPGGARPTVLARSVDDWLTSSHGQRTSEFIAETDDYLTLHGMFRRNAKESNVDTGFISALQQTTDPTEVKNLIKAAADGGYQGGATLSQLPVPQSLVGRAVGSSGLAGVVARGMGGSGSAVDVLGLRQAIKTNRQSTSYLGRMAAEVGATALRVDNIDTSVDDFGQWMKAAGFDPDRMSEYMGRMAALPRGAADTAPKMWGIVKGAYSELAAKMVDDGIRPDVAKAFTQAFNTVDDYRKFWIDNAGNPAMFAGSRFDVMVNGQVQAIPTAQLFSEFMDWSIPLLDMRKIRKGLNRSAWAKAGAGDLATKRIKSARDPGQALPRFKLEDMEGWDDLGPGVLASLMDNAVQRVWKPLVLLRIAWPVRVLAEEQVRMLAVGMDNIYNHPMHGIMLALNKNYRKGYLAQDVMGGSFEDAVAYRNAMSKKGLEFGLGRARSMHPSEYIKADKGSPQYWNGLAIELQQLADDPIVQRIARALVDGDPDAARTDLLKPIKDEFWDETTELGRARKALAADASNWDIVNIREAADALIDDRYARLLSRTGGDYVKSDQLKGIYADSYGNQLTFDEAAGGWRNPQTGELHDLPEVPDFAAPLHVRQMPVEYERAARPLEEIIARNEALGFGDLDRTTPLVESVEQANQWADALEEFDRTLRMIERSSGRAYVDLNLYDYHGVDPRDTAELLRRNADRIAAGDPAATRTAAGHIDGLRRVVDDARYDASVRADPTGRASTRAMDVIELAGQPDMLRARFAGLRKLHGPDGKIYDLEDWIENFGSKMSWTREEVVNMIPSEISSLGRFQVTQVTDEQLAKLYPEGSTAGTRTWTEPLFYDDPAAGEQIFVAHDGFITGRLAIKRDPSGKIINVDQLQVAKGDERAVEHLVGGGQPEAVRPVRNAFDEWEQIGDDEWVEVYHATDPETARRLVDEGTAGEKAVVEHRTELTGEGLYVGADPDRLRHLFGGQGPEQPGTIVAVRVRKRDIVESPEGQGLYPGDIARALDDPVVGARITDQVEGSNFRILSEDEIVGAPRPPDVTPTPAKSSLPGENTDTMRLLKHALGEDNMNPEDIYDLAFGGVPVRDWLQSAGHTPDKFGLAEMAEFMRQQSGASWADSRVGPLGPLPSIELTPDGAAALGRTIHNAGKYGKAEVSAAGWPQRHMTAHAVREPDGELLEAVADGRLGDLDLSTRNLLDEPEKIARIDQLGSVLRDGWGESLDMLPNYVKTAKPEDLKKMGGFVDHMYDMLMSRPTNTLSRAPAFKQFYYRRIAELMPYMDDATKAKALQAAREAGVGRGDLRSMVKAAFTRDGVTEAKLESMADDFIKGRFEAGTGDITDLAQADEIAKAFALQETKRLLYDLTKKTQFFDMTRNIFPFGEAWWEIISTWGRIINENPQVIRRLQQGMQGARQEGIFYNDPSTGEEVFAMPHLDFLSKLTGVTEGDDKAQPKFTGRVEGVNLILNNYLPGLGPVVQMPAASFARDIIDKPELRWLRDLVFPYGYPDAENPGAIVNSVMPAWFRKALTSIGRPTGEDERLYNNTVIDVLRAMELNGEIREGLTGPEAARVMELARSRASRIFTLRTIQQFVGPTGAQVRWDVEIDPDGEAFAYQVLATEYRKMIEDAEGDRVVAFNNFVNQFGFDPAGIATAKTTQVRPRAVTEEGQDFKQANPELFESYPLTAYYVAPDPPDGEFDYSAYLAQLRDGDRMPVTPEQWETERNRMLGSVTYEKARRAAVDQGIRNEPGVQAYLRALRYNLMEQYPGYGFDVVGGATQPEQRQFMAEFDKWRDDPQLSQTPAGRGLNAYLAQRDRALKLAEAEWGVSEEGFATAKSTAALREYLLGVGRHLTRQYPDFGTIYQRHYLWEVETPEAVVPAELLGVDLSTDETETEEP